MGSDISHERLRVLIIDDSLVIRALIEEIMESEKDCKVVGAASNVVTARHMINDLLPNVITLDLNMPGIGGIALLDEVRDQKHPAIVVVSSASSAESTASKEAVEHGASACFDKAKIVSDRSGFVLTLRQAVKNHHKLNHNAVPTCSAISIQKCDLEAEGAFDDSIDLI